MATNTLILELGEKIVKVCVSTKKNRKFQILDSFMFQTPERSVVDGQIVDQEAMAAALQEQMTENAVTDVKKVIFTLNSSKVATREITIPLVKENRIRTMIETNAEEYFPVELSNYQLAYNILERVKGENPGYRILVLAVPRTMVNSYIRLTELLGLPVEAIDYCGNSQYQVLRQIDNNNVVMYVDINLTNTYVNFMENGILLLQRNLAIGGDQLLSAVMQKGGYEENEYLAVLQQLSDEAYMDSIIPMRDRRMALNRLAYNVMRMMDFFRTNFKEKEISQIVLMGTCSNIAGLTELIKADTGLETVHIFELDEMKSLANSADGVTFYLSCIGTLIAPLNLLPEDYATRKKKKKDEGALRNAQAFCAVCVVAALGLCAYGAYTYKIRDEKLAAVRARADRMSEVKEIYSTYEDYEQTNSNLQILKDYKVTPNANLVKFLEELEEKMPKELSLLSAECTDVDVVMNITTPGFEEAAVTLAQIRTFESLDSIEVSDMVKNVEEDGTETVSFSIRCVYGEMPTEEQVEQEQ